MKRLARSNDYPCVPKGTLTVPRAELDYYRMEPKRMTTVTIELEQDLLEFVQQNLASGRFRDERELIRAKLTMLALNGAEPLPGHPELPRARLRGTRPDRAGRDRRWR